jgi:hypothetical protein
LLIVVTIVVALSTSCSYQTAATGADTDVTSQATALRGKPLKLQLGEFEYSGGFRVPFGMVGSSGFSYGGTALAFNPHRDSLFVVGHDHQQAIAEIAVPQVVNSDRIEDLKTAEVVQAFTDVKLRIPNWTLEGNVKIGGLIVVEDELIGTVYEYFDGDGNAVRSHFKLSSLDLANAKVSGLFKVGNHGGGYVGGYMSKVPSMWRDKLGISYVTGQTGLPIISRTSAGPAIFGFEPAQLGAGAAPTIPLLYYPFFHGGSHPDDHPLADPSSQNPHYNTTTEIKGLVFPEGSDHIFFLGSHGVGRWWYGSNGDFPGLNDPFITSKGPHAAPYVFQMWAYDVHDLLAVKNRSRQPWQVKPRNVWTFDLPFEVGRKNIGGVAFDAKRRRMYLSQLFADRVGHDMNPIIHVFHLSPATDGEANRN